MVKFVLPIVIVRLLTILAVLASFGAPRNAAARGQERYWVGTWACAPQLTEPANLPPAPGLADTTLRQIVHVSLGGKRLRVRISNAYGTSPLTINAAHVALSLGGSRIKPESDRSLTFSGQPAATILPGALIVSDPVAFDLAPLSNRQ